MTFKKILGTSLLLFASGVSGVSAANLTRYAIADVSSQGVDAQKMRLYQSAHPFIKFSIANIQGLISTAKLRVYFASQPLNGANSTYQLRLVGANSDNWNNDDFGSSGLPGAPQLNWLPGALTIESPPAKSYVEFNILDYVASPVQLDLLVNNIAANNLITAEIQRINGVGWDFIVSSEGNDYKYRPRLILATDQQNLIAQSAALIPQLSVPLTSTVHGDFKFRMSGGMTHDNYEDPIVSPGGINATHHHMFFANGYVNRDSTPASLKEETGVDNLWMYGKGVNRSGYWVPVMYDGNDDPVPLGFHQVYYTRSSQLYGGEEGGTPAEYQTWVGGSGYASPASGAVMPMPEGLTMVTQRGDHQAYEFTCIAHTQSTQRFSTTGYVYANHAKKGHRIPTCSNKANFLQMKIFFPDCWDGNSSHLTDKMIDSDVNFTGDKSGSHSHMTYSSKSRGLDNNGVANSGCPTNFPVQLPQVIYQFAYPIQTDAGDTKDYYLSSDVHLGPNEQGCAGTDPDNGGTNGCSAHGDWMNGWNPIVMDQLVGRNKLGQKVNANSCLGSNENHCSDGNITSTHGLKTIPAGNDNFTTRNITHRDRQGRGFFSNKTP